MESHLSKVKGLSLLALLLTGLIACGVGGDTGRLSMSLTDRPTDDYQAVYVTIKDVAVHAAGDPEGTWTTVLDLNKTYNLMVLANGVREQLGIVSLDPGDYTQLRLIIGTESDGGTNILDDVHPFANYVIDMDGATHEMKIPSGIQTGIKLVQGFEINENATTELTFDFDASRSVVVAGNSGKYILKPTIQVIDTEVATVINGTVTTTEGAATVGVPGALVTIQVYVDQTDPVIDDVIVKTSTFTDDTGAYKFFFAVVEPTTFNLVTTKTDFAPAFDQIIDAVSGNAYTRNFTLVAPAAVGTVDIAIAGAPTDETPVTLSFRQAVTIGSANTVVEVKSLSFLNGAYPGDQDYQVVLPAGDYKVVASTPGKASLEIPLTVTATPNAQLSVSFPI